MLLNSSSFSVGLNSYIRQKGKSLMHGVVIRKTMRTLAVGAICLAAMQAHMATAQDRRTIDQKSIDRRIDDQYNVYWGDLHNHSDLTYGHGSYENALENAAQQLDFFTVTPHAMWPDINRLKGNKELEWVIGYHTAAFEKLRQTPYWRNYIDRLASYNSKGKVVTFPSFEVHSLKYGDHVVVSKDPDISLPKAGTTIVELRDKVLDKENTIITPHGIGYQSGYRGYNWQYFKEGPQTPFVEIFSRHGGSEGSIGPFGMYHDMGPRSYEGTAEAGLKKGNKFGIMASSDSHAGHPGSYGGGRLGILAPELSRDAIWEAIRARRIYATTGANIKVDFRINDAHMGQEISDTGKNRQIHVAVEGMQQLDYVEVIKNGRMLQRVSGDYTPQASLDGSIRAKITFEFGWNQVASKDRVHWVGDLSLSGGKIVSATSQFRGAPFTSPQKDLEGNEVPWESYINRITKVEERKVGIDAYSESNPAPTQPITQSVVLDVEMKATDTVTANLNGKTFSHSLAELLEGTRGHFMRGWLTEAISFRRAVPESGFKLGFDIEDEADSDEDYYFVRVRQTDNQWAWASPIWVSKSTGLAKQ